MHFTPPGPKEFQEVAAALGVALDEDTANLLSRHAQGFSASMQWLDSAPDELPPLKYPTRSWRRPAPEENPLDAWYVRTEIRGAESGPLRGRQVAIKDNILVAGVPMMNGAAFLDGFVPDVDATVVTRILDAGATIAGKSVCEFLCVSGGSATASTGIVRNPHHPDYSAGGSSSGSAALVASGSVDLALGCDQAGSIRIPSSWCGAVGMKPTHGLVPYTGILGMEGMLDYVGPITANVPDNALLLQAIAGNDDLDYRQRNVQVHPYAQSLGEKITGLRIGILHEGFGHPLGEPDVDECVRAAAGRLATLGATVAEVSVPLHIDGVAIWGGVISDALWQTLWMNGTALNTDGVFSPSFNRAMEGWDRQLGRFPPNAQMLLLLGKYLERYRGRYTAKAKNLVRRLRRAYDQALEQYDLLLLPTTILKPVRNPAGTGVADTELLMTAAFNTVLNTCQFDISGHPALSLPCGLRAGLPVGMMLVGRHFHESTIYRAAHALEQSGDWRQW
jgi:amidase